MTTCNCGSGEKSYWRSDARGIPLAKVCKRCEKKKLSTFRPEVLTNSNYHTDEAVNDE